MEGGNVNSTAGEGETPRLPTTPVSTSVEDLDDAAKVMVAMAHLAFSKNQPKGQYRQPRKWTVRFADEAGNIVKEGTYQQDWNVEGYLQSGGDSSTGTSAGMTLPAYLQVTPDKTKRGGRTTEKGCYCCGKIGHKLKRCPYNK